MLEKTLESPLDSKEIQPVHPKGNQSWIFIGRTDAEAEIPVFWTSDVKNWLIWKDPDSGKDRRREDNRRWDGWMASLTRWTWIWASFGSWWWTGKPVVLQSMGSQSQTRLSDWTELNNVCSKSSFHLLTGPFLSCELPIHSLFSFLKFDSSVKLLYKCFCVLGKLTPFLYVSQGFFLFVCFTSLFSFDFVYAIQNLILSSLSSSRTGPCYFKDSLLRNYRTKAEHY